MKAGQKASDISPAFTVFGGQDDVVLHFWLEVHPDAVQLAVRDAPSGFRHALSVRAQLWLQRQPVPKECGVFGTLKLDIGRSRVLVSGGCN